MIKTLRTVHYAVWPALAIVLTLVFIFSLALKPKSREEDVTHRSYEVSLKKKEAGYALLVTVPKNTSFASCVVRVRIAQQMHIVANLEGPGDFEVELPLPGIEFPLQIELFDSIRGRYIKSTELKLDADR